VILGMVKLIAILGLYFYHFHLLGMVGMVKLDYYIRALKYFSNNNELS